MARPALTTASSGFDPEGWIHRHGDVLYRYALVRVRNQATAEDLVQETLLAALDGARTFEHRSTERTWLIGILRHKVLDHFRQQSRDRVVLSDSMELLEREGFFDDTGRWAVPVDEWHSPEASLENVEFWRVFNECVSDLPENLKTPFALRELEGVESDVLAGILRTTKNNLWVILSRARQRLRRCLQHRWFVEQ